MDEHQDGGAGADFYDNKSMTDQDHQFNDQYMCNDINKKDKYGTSEVPDWNKDSKIALGQGTVRSP